jgi:hypothetical protein
VLSGQEGNITIDADENLVAHVKIEMKTSLLLPEKIATSVQIKNCSLLSPFESLNAVSLVGSGNALLKETKAKVFKAT